MTTATVTSKGQITIPAGVRDALHVGTGDRVKFVQIEPGRFEFVAATRSVRELKGMFGKPAKAVTIDAMNQACWCQCGSEPNADRRLSHGHRSAPGAKLEFWRASTASTQTRRMAQVGVGANILEPRWHRAGSHQARAASSLACNSSCSRLEPLVSTASSAATRAHNSQLPAAITIK